MLHTCVTHASWRDSDMDMLCSLNESLDLSLGVRGWLWSPYRLWDNHDGALCSASWTLRRWRQVHVVCVPSLLHQEEDSTLLLTNFKVGAFRIRSGGEQVAPSPP